MTGFFDSLRSRSTFFRILGDAGFSRQPLRTRMGIVVADATGWIVGAGKPVPLSSMGFDGATLEEHKACALVVCTEELLQATGSAAEAAFGRALRGAVANVVDRHFLDLIGQGITPQAGTASPDADIKTLLDTVNTTGSGSLYWIMTPSLANLLVSLRGAAGTRVFPDMTPLGGSIVGLPALVTTEARAAAGSPATDALWLIDASQIVADATGIEVDMSREATIEMDDAPGMDAVAPTGPTGPLVSLWQQNCAAMMAKVWFGARRLRSNAIAVLEGVNWS
jgi:HK97 family phage major capsid protein